MIYSFIFQKSKKKKIPDQDFKTYEKNFLIISHISLAFLFQVMLINSLRVIICCEESKYLIPDKETFSGFLKNK
jgi:hypothetical protein